MATGIVDYASLKTELGNFVHRADLTSELDTLIQLCENNLNRELRVRQMDTYVQIAANTRMVSLPGDFLTARSIDINASPVIPLKYVTPEQMMLYDLQSNTARPRNFTIEGSYIILSPNPDTTYILDLEYVQKIPTLVNGANTSNWLILSYPDIYLYGSLLAATAFLENDPRVALWQQAYSDAREQLESKSYGYSGSEFRMRTDSGQF